MMNKITFLKIAFLTVTTACVIGCSSQSKDTSLIAQKSELATPSSSSMTTLSEQDLAKPGLATHDLAKQGNNTIDHVVKSSARAAQVNFEHSVNQARAKVGEPYMIDIKFLGSANTDMTATFGATPDLVMSSASQMSVLFNEKGRANTQRIIVTPQREGIHFVTIYKYGAQTQDKPAAIKVIAGDKPEQDYLIKVGPVVEEADGRRIIQVPAEEG